MKNLCSLSFRGANEVSEPGIRKQVQPSHLDSGPGAKRRPGMTVMS